MFFPPPENRPPPPSFSRIRTDPAFRSPRNLPPPPFFFPSTFPLFPFRSEKGPSSFFFIPSPSGCCCFLLFSFSPLPLDSALRFPSLADPGKIPFALCPCGCSTAGLPPLSFPSSPPSSDRQSFFLLFPHGGVIPLLPPQLPLLPRPPPFFPFLMTRPPLPPTATEAVVLSLLL